MIEAQENNTTGREFQFTDTDFSRVKKLLFSHTGIKLADSKRQMVYSRLVRRVRALDLPSFANYLDFLVEHEGDELVHFKNAMTTNLTAFFREGHHFEYLANTIFPKLRTVHNNDRRIRIWSAGCSTGEEPYSLAVVLRENFPKNSGWDVRILATDIDTNVLQTAKDGVYSLDRVKNISPERLKKWFLKGTGAHKDTAIAKDELKEVIRFRQLNLMGQWPIKKKFDVIFCRNVIIYFDKPTQRVLVDRYANLLEKDGHLFLGHSESLFKVTERFNLIGKTIYQKTK